MVRPTPDPLLAPLDHPRSLGTPEAGAPLIDCCSMVAMADGPVVPLGHARWSLERGGYRRSCSLWPWCYCYGRARRDKTGRGQAVPGLGESEHAARRQIGKRPRWSGRKNHSMRPSDPDRIRLDSTCPWIDNGKAPDPSCCGWSSACVLTARSSNVTLRWHGLRWT